MIDKIIYWGTLVFAWVLLPIGMVIVATKTVVSFIERTIEELER